MTVGQIMTRGIETVEPRTTLRSAAEAMKTLDIGFLVVAEDNRLQGLLTDRDIVTRGVADGLDPDTTNVGQLLTERIWMVGQDETIEDAAALMREKHVRRLIVCDESGRATGVVSLGDIAAEGGDDTRAGRTLHEISEPSHPAR